MLRSRRAVLMPSDGQLHVREAQPEQGPIPLSLVLRDVPVLRGELTLLGARDGDHRPPSLGTLPGRRRCGTTGWSRYADVIGKVWPTSPFHWLLCTVQRTVQSQPPGCSGFPFGTRYVDPIWHAPCASTCVQRG